MGWEYGSGMKLAKPFLKATEGVANKVIHYTTGIHINYEKEEEIYVKPKLAELDERFVNPATARLLHILAPFQDRVDDKLRPIINMALKKIYFLNHFCSEEKDKLMRFRKLKISI